MRLRRPAPATVIAIVALVFAVGGFAVAAIPDPGGKIHACYKTSGGALRVVSGTQCGPGEKSISWNQGVARVRRATVTIKYSCNQIPMTSSYSCGGNGTNAALCGAAERATGGGYELPPSSLQQGFSVLASRPGPPTAGSKPTRWFVSVTSGGASTTPTRPDAHIPIYAVCAA
jgi:hypothetical protein